MRRVVVVLAASVLSLAGGLPAASATTNDGRMNHEFVTLYYTNSSHTGSPVGRYYYGWCPDFFTSRTGTTTQYSVTTSYEC
ncbi:hypothetical protein [Labedaea rhizosphaerae]|uniref:Uncharacterized protein n=1 Tax=Labedaea rhizosphaerae TaxID=598644 RepID=A0A4R6SCS7_LABRH|nr:hypothetical protein [Labedaea rhizosphaerae]TDP96795.1 hypothetical protein EV186_104783 [Labedaea rhizosphaerae]